MQVRARSDEDKAVLRQIILNAAVDLYAEAGYEGFSMRKLATRIGYTATTIYRYFADKNDLLLTVIDNGFHDLFHDYMESDAPTPRERFVDMATGFVRFARENPELFRLMFLSRPGLTFDLEGDDVHRIRLGKLDLFRELAMESGLIPHLDAEQAAVAADLLFAVGYGLAGLPISLPVFSEERADRALAFLLDYIEAHWDDATTESQG